MLLSLGMSTILFPSVSPAHLCCQIIHLLLTPSLPSPAPYTFDKFDSSPDRQMSPLCGPAPDPVCRHIKGGIQMTNSCHLLWCYVTWWHPRMTNTTMMRFLRLGQLEMGNKIVNFTVNLCLQVLENYFVSECMMTLELKMFPDRKMKW